MLQQHGATNSAARSVCRRRRFTRRSVLRRDFVRYRIGFKACVADLLTMRGHRTAQEHDDLATAISLSVTLFLLLLVLCIWLALSFARLARDLEKKKRDIDHKMKIGREGWSEEALSRVGQAL